MVAALKMRLRTANLTGGALSGSGTLGATGGAIPATFFGMHNGDLTATSIWGDNGAGTTINGVHYSVSQIYTPTPWVSGGIVGTFRLWDGNGCTWRAINSVKGVYNWSYLDQYIAAIKANGVAQVIYNLGCGPDWATPSGYAQNPGTCMGYNSAAPNSINNVGQTISDWNVWCAAVATHFVASGLTGVVYEIWNEVNGNTTPGVASNPTGFNGTVQQLLDLARNARATILAIDPTAKFTTPNFTGPTGIVAVGDQNTLDNYLSLGGGAYADIISVHGYNALSAFNSPYPQPEGLYMMGRFVATTAAKYNLSALPIINTEFGFGQWQGSNGKYHSVSATDALTRNGGEAYPYPMPDALGAAFVTRSFALNWLSGMKCLCLFGADVYGWSSIQYFATNAYNYAVSPIVARSPLVAWQYFSTLMLGAQLYGFAQNVVAGKPYYVACFVTASGRSGLMLWTANWQTATVTVQNATEIRDNLGNLQTLSTSIALTHSPLFVFTS